MSRTEDDVESYQNLRLPGLIITHFPHNSPTQYLVASQVDYSVVLRKVFFIVRDLGSQQPHFARPSFLLYFA